MAHSCVRRRSPGFPEVHKSATELTEMSFLIVEQLVLGLIRILKGNQRPRLSLVRFHLPLTSRFLFHFNDYVVRYFNIETNFSVASSSSRPRTKESRDNDFIKINHINRISENNKVPGVGRSHKA
jgi:hypothetical protein